MTTVSKEVKIEFDGMSEKKSTDYQLSEWVKGRSLHNPITDICCPDFSCCTGEIMNEEIRIKFSNAYKMNDEKTQMNILNMALSGLFSTEKLNVHIAGENNTIN